MRDGEIVALTPKEFDVLLLLVENSGRTVEKHDILEAVWPDVFVEEGTLTRNVSWLRKKLAAAGGNGGRDIIETLPKRGYRFLPGVSRGSELVIEEQTIHQIRVEEIIEIIPSPGDGLDHNILPSASRGRNLLFVTTLAALLAVIAALLFYRGGPSANKSQILGAPKIVPFSGLPGRENFPAFSPDGKQVIFSWDGGIEGGELDVYVKLIGTGEPVRLTDTPIDEINPVFAPDGRSVAFVRIFPDHNEIVAKPALGGAESKIHEHASYASISFSPDGKTLAAADLDLVDGKAGIFLIDLASGETKRVSTPEAPAVDHTPRFSPDGKNLAFIRYFSSFKREIFVIPAGGGDAREITSDDVRIYGLTWSADSGSIFFTSYRDVGRLNLWRVSAVGGQPEMLPTGSKELEGLALSPDGKTLAFVEETSDENIWEVTPGSAPKPVVRSARADHSQQFSPDGTRIVFASDRTGNYEIWLAEADGRNQQQLTSSGGSCGSPRFSPDGTRVIYDNQTAGSSDIYSAPVNGGTPLRLTVDGKNNSMPAWSLDGKNVFFISNRSGSDQIWKIPSGGGEPVQITRQGAFEIYPAPDGKTIYYSKGSGKTGIWQVETSGGEELPVDGLKDTGGWRSWSVTPKGVFFTAFSTQPPFRIRFFDLSLRQVKDVTTTDRPPLTYYSNLAVSPDGKRILYSRQDQSASSIMLAELP